MRKNIRRAKLYSIFLFLTRFDVGLFPQTKKVLLLTLPIFVKYAFIK